MTDGEEPSTQKKRSVGEAYMVETHGSKVGKRAATTAKNSQRCNELNALRMSRVASTQPGWDWRRAVTVWAKKGKPAQR